MALADFSDLAILFIQDSFEFFNLLIFFLDGPFKLRSIDLRNTSILELFLEAVYFLFFHLHLSDQLFKLVSIDSASILFLLQLVVLSLVFFQHLLQFNVLSMKAIQLFFVGLNFLHIGIHLVFNLCANATLSVHFELVECLFVLVFELSTVFFQLSVLLVWNSTPASA
jgi:hypothetical protein